MYVKFSMRVIGQGVNGKAVSVVGGELIGSITNEVSVRAISGEMGTN